MNDDQLTAWVTQWSCRYDPAQDHMLQGVLGRHSLDRAGFEAVIDWAFALKRHDRALQDLTVESDAELVDLSAAARRCASDTAAVRIIGCVNGVGLALGSALLMVMDPDRWTVLDRRTLTSVRTIGYDTVPSNSLRYATWTPFCAACRDITARTRLPLRTVYRALHIASGEPAMPTGYT